jgi:hypothetical protein
VGNKPVATDRPKRARCQFCRAIVEVKADRTFVIHLRSRWLGVCAGSYKAVGTKPAEQPDE